MTIQGIRTADANTVEIQGIRRMGRIRTDLKGAATRAGWILYDEEGIGFLYDDIIHITQIKEETER